MELSRNEIEGLISEHLANWGFSPKDASLIISNMSAAELAGKTSHGYSSIFWFKDVVDGKYGQIAISEGSPEVLRQNQATLQIDGKQNTGYVVMDFALRQSLSLVKEFGLIGTTLANTAPTIGYVGDWARQATKNGHIFICFSNASSSTSPHGTTGKLYGTNPITIGIPSAHDPIILDMATASTTYATIMRAKALGKDLPDICGINSEGNLTLDPVSILSGGAIFPFGGYKGSGLAFMVELLAGALTGSKVGANGKSSWGTFFMLIDPEFFTDKTSFHQNIQQLVDDLHKNPKRPGFTDTFYPGEQSNLKTKQNSLKDTLSVDDNFLERMKTL
jgi:LDH2 family malate/lactate/ureidoglycolate dehydrogenase